LEQGRDRLKYNRARSVRYGSFRKLSVTASAARSVTVISIRAQKISLLPVVRSAAHLPRHDVMQQTYAAEP